MFKKRDGTMNPIRKLLLLMALLQGSLLLVVGDADVVSSYGEGVADIRDESRVSLVATEEGVMDPLN